MTRGWLQTNELIGEDERWSETDERIGEDGGEREAHVEFLCGASSGGAGASPRRAKGRVARSQLLFLSEVNSAHVDNLLD